MPIQDRYDTPIDTKILPSGREVYTSLLPTFVQSNPVSDVQITATDVIRMDVLANNVYGTSEDWWRIASANGKVDGSLYFRPGSSIIIPKK